jgi:hypothetical protein
MAAFLLVAGFVLGHVEFRFVAPGDEKVFKRAQTHIIQYSENRLAKA